MLHIETVELILDKVLKNHFKQDVLYDTINRIWLRILKDVK